ncbi:uncharacterized [Tachysurus ichikawai]
MDSGNPGTQELVCRLSLSSTLTRPTASTSPAPPPFTPYPVSEQGNRKGHGEALRRSVVRHLSQENEVTPPNSPCTTLYLA